MKKLLFFILIFPLICLATNKDNKYDIRNIPLKLFADADAIIRNDETIFEIEDNNSAILKVKYAITILNKDAQHYGILSIGYDKFRTIEELDAIIFDADGEEIRDLEKSDIKDYSDFENFTLYSDNRIKMLSLFHDKYPYTIEFTYEIEYDGYLNWPTWSSRNSLEPVQKTIFEVIVPYKYELRFWCNSNEIEPEIKVNNDGKSYLWEDKNLMKLSSDIYGEDVEDIATIVRIAPSDFELDGHKGNMNSWKDFGLWYYELTKGKDVLPETAIREIGQNISSIPDIQSKIKTLYKYFQSKTRYVSVQLGIGSWQPYDATFVYKNGYGDCKALSNYMISILKAAGISAYPVLIHNGFYRTPFIKEFPSNQFNHVIVCVPLTSDTIWLECTSQILPTGRIGDDNENREALMITPKGGVVVKTPSSSYSDNKQIKNIIVEFLKDGNLNVSANIKFYGNQYDYPIYVFKELTPEKQENWIRKLFEVPDITINRYNFSEVDDNSPIIELSTELQLKKYAPFSGQRIFFNPNLLERRKTIPKSVEKRLSPIRFHYQYLDIDSIKYIIPESYKVETIPKDLIIESSFGKFLSRTITDENNSIIYIRSLEINKYLIPPDNYNDYQDFFAKIAKADKQQIILIKSE